VSGNRCIWGRTRRAVTALAAALACAAGAQAADAAARRLPALSPGSDGIAQALRTGRISEAEYALERVRALTEPDRARRLFGAVERPDPREGTILLRDLAARLDELPTPDRTLAERLLARPTSATDSIRHYRAPARHVCGPRICYWWVESTSDAPSLKDVDGNGIPDWVDRTKRVFAHVWDVEVDRMGYRRPRSDRTSPVHGPNGKLDVFIANVGAIGFYGYCTSDDPARGTRATASAYCVVDDDFSRRQFHGSATGVNALRVTAAHEFFHAVQYGYDWLEDLWLMEGTAVWMEDVVFDGVNDNRQYLKVSPLATAYAMLPLDHDNPDYNEPDAGFHYGVWIFWRYLTERYGPGVVRGVWKRADGRAGSPDDYSAKALAKVLKNRGRVLANVLADFAAANLRPNASYSEGAAYPTPGPVSTVPVGAGGVAPTHVPVSHFSSSYYAFVPSGLPETATLTFTLDLPAAPVPARASAVVTDAGGAVTRIPAVFDGGSGQWTISVSSFGSAQKVTLVLTNGSVRYNCWRGYVYSCRGQPLDDVQFGLAAGVS
jgi:hypothetical protein